MLRVDRFGRTRVPTRMSTSKKLSKPVVVGRKLRRYLGALLAIGFGATWWSFVPPSTASASVPAETRQVRAPRPGAVSVAVVPSYMPAHPTRRLLTVTPHKHPRPHHVAPKLHVVIEPPPIIDTVVVTLPVVQMPVIEPVPEPQPEPDPDYINIIRTRSS